MYCAYCGKEVNDNAAFCLNCGAEIKKPIADDSKGSRSWWWMGFLLPVLGLFLWLFCSDTQPTKAKKAGAGALVGFIVSVIFAVLFFVLWFALILGVAQGVYV